MTSLSSTPRTRLRRHPERAGTDRAALHAVLDACTIVHVAVPGPVLLPMAFGRIDERLYLHGARANGLLARALEADAEVCVCATRVDGLVLARSAFHHSMNYRSAVVFGRLLEVEGEEKRAALDAIVEHTLPGRAAECRATNERELKATLVARLDLAEASVKVRAKGAVDAEADLALPFWAGVLPLDERAAFAQPEPDTPSPPASLARAALARAPRLTEDGAHERYTISGDPRRLELDRVLGWLRSDEAYWSTDLTFARLLRTVQGSYVVGAYEGSRQVAFARVVTDGETFAWLADVFVDPAHRGRGLSRALVGYLVGHPTFARLRRWMLATRDAHGVYAPEGFGPLPDGRFLERVSERAGSPEVAAE